MERGELVGDDLMIGIVRERLSAARRGRRVRPRRVPADGRPGAGARRPDGGPRPARRRRHRGAGGRAGAAADRSQGVRRVRHERRSPDRRRPARRCGGALVQRADDREDVVRERLRVYARDTQPLVEFYRDRPTFRSVNGAQPPEAVAADLVAAIEAAAGAGSVGQGGRRAGAEPVIVCKSAAEIGRMRAANLLVAEVLGELRRQSAPGVTTAELDDLAETRIRAAARAGVQGIPRVPGDDLRVGERRGDPRDPVAARPGRGRHPVDRRRRAARRLLRRRGDHGAGRPGLGARPRGCCG